MLTVLFSLAAATLLISADQLIKWWARTFLAPAEPIWLIEGIFQLTYVENRGAAWGLFQGQRWPLLIVTGIVLILLLCCKHPSLFINHKKAHKEDWNRRIC